MSKRNQSSKAVKTVLWQPISDQQAETVKGGNTYYSDDKYDWCISTGKYVYSRY